MTASQLSAPVLGPRVVALLEPVRAPAPLVAFDGSRVSPGLSFPPDLPWLRAPVGFAAVP